MGETGKKAAWARAEAINPHRLMTVTERADGRVFIARFTTDEGLRGFRQTLLSWPDGSFGVLILADGTIPTDTVARRMIAPATVGDEEIVVTAQLTYSCPAEARLSEQSDNIHADLCRLLEADETTGVSCTAVTIAHLSAEAETYGNVFSDNVPLIQADRMEEALKTLFPDAGCDGERLRNALCDLRHFARARGLDFALWDRTAAQYHAAEEGRGVQDKRSGTTTTDGEGGEGGEKEESRLSVL